MQTSPQQTKYLLCSVWQAQKGQGEWLRLPEDCWGHSLPGKQETSLLLTFVKFLRSKTENPGDFKIPGPLNLQSNGVENVLKGVRILGELLILPASVVSMFLFFRGE